MANKIDLDFSQDVPNKLTEIANAERQKLIPKNDFFKDGNQYSATNPDAIADGDSMGRGTGTFLDVYNNGAGTIEDVVERKQEIKINRYNSQKTYPDF